MLIVLVLEREEVEYILQNSIKRKKVVVCSKHILNMINTLAMKNDFFFPLSYAPKILYAS